MKSIMQLALEGKSNPEIAETLNISGETVHSQKKIAYRKLRVYLKDYYYLVFLLFIVSFKKTFLIHPDFQFTCFSINND